MDKYEKRFIKIFDYCALLFGLSGIVLILIDYQSTGLDERLRKELFSGWTLVFIAAVFLMLRFVSIAFPNDKE